MRSGERFAFVVDPDIVGRMDRVVVINDGKIVSKTRKADLVQYEVEKT